MPFASLSDTDPGQVLRSGERVSFSIPAETCAVRCVRPTMEFARTAGLDVRSSWELATAVVELVTNVVKYARTGTLTLELVFQGRRAGVAVIVEDEGLGVADVERALLDGYSSGGGLGLGLGAVRRLTDEFEIVSEVGRGTRVIARKWARVT